MPDITNVPAEFIYDYIKGWWDAVAFSYIHTLDGEHFIWWQNGYKACMQEMGKL